mmetsp:Transcript_17681/g.43478  ORF Transcript_17681/g.43478 Transcript_17681/m.43478 type:complete len:235 (+) Transcript_17681:1112-1816(+)
MVPLALTLKLHSWLRPKSHSFTWLLPREMSMLSGLRSRCAMPLACTAHMADAVSLSHRTHVSTSMRPALAPDAPPPLPVPLDSAALELVRDGRLRASSAARCSTSPTLPPSTYSIAITSLSGFSYAPWNAAMFGCRMLAITAHSRCHARRSNAPVAFCTFTATVDPCNVPRYTAPYAPSPSLSLLVNSTSSSSSSHAFTISIAPSTCCCSAARRAAAAAPSAPSSAMTNGSDPV